MHRLASLLVAAALASPSFAAPGVEMRVSGGEWTPRTNVTVFAGEDVDVRVVGASEDVRWYELLPDLGRDHHNAEWPWNPGAYKWLGYERIAVERVEIEAWRGRSTIRLVDGVPPELPASHEETRAWLRRRRVGTFWLQAVSSAGSTPGIEDADARGLLPSTLRVSVRGGDDFRGWVETFANVPSVFGSTPYQSRNWIGADCADVVMTARAAWLDEPLDRDWNVAGVVGSLRHLAETDLTEGEASDDLRWGRDVHDGDVIAVRYAGGRQYQHVGVLVGDADGDGRLGAGDAVLHAGPLPLALSLLRDGPFDGHVVVMSPGRRPRSMQ